VKNLTEKVGNCLFCRKPKTKMIVENEFCSKECVMLYKTVQQHASEIERSHNRIGMLDRIIVKLSMGKKYENFLLTFQSDKEECDTDFLNKLEEGTSIKQSERALWATVLQTNIGDFLRNAQYKRRSGLDDDYDLDRRWINGRDFDYICSELLDLNTDWIRSGVFAAERRGDKIAAHLMHN
jgi:hypothetical protein